MSALPGCMLTLDRDQLHALQPAVAQAAPRVCVTKPDVVRMPYVQEAAIFYVRMTRGRRRCRWQSMQRAQTWPLAARVR